MKRSRILFALGTLAVLVLLVGYLAIQFSKPTPFNSEIQEYYAQVTISSQDAESIAPEFINALPKIAPLLREMLRGADTRWDRGIRGLRARTPEAIQHLLPERPNKDKLRAATCFVLPGLGPYARPLLPTLIERLPTSAPVEAQYIVRSLVWFVPESPAATEAFRTYIREHSADRSLFGVFDPSFPNPHNVWTQIPDLADGIVPWLRYPDSYYDAITALHYLGPLANAVGPHLLKVWHNPIQFTRPPAHRSLEATDHSVIATQCRAIEAIGAIQFVNSEVLSILTNAWKAENPSYRASAARAVRHLGNKTAPIIHDVFPFLDYSNEQVLSLQFQALGSMAVADPDLIRLLRTWATYNEEAIIWEDPSNVSNFRIEPIRLSPRYAAAVGLWRMRPEDHPDLGTIIAEVLQGTLKNTGAKIHPFLETFRSGSKFILPAAHGMMKQLNPFEQTKFAGRLLYLAPDDEVSKQILVDTMNDTAPDRAADSAIAARDFYQATGEFTLPIETLKRLLSRPVGSVREQLVLSCVEALGKNAEALAPLITPFLKDDKVRVQAWLTLRAISPEEYSRLGLPASRPSE